MTTTQPTAGPATEHALVIDIWSDIACPWCYLGGHRLGVAIGALPQADSIAVRTRSFELDPAAPREAGSTLDYLAGKFGVSRAQAEQLDSRLVELAAADGLPYVSDRPHANSLDVHRVVQLARTVGLSEQLFAALQQALFGRGLNVYDHAELSQLAVAAGLDPERVGQLLAGDGFTDQVRADETEAHERGVSGVPFAVIGGRYAIPGATSVEQYRAVIERAWAER